ncbi:MAG: hypothetical protein Q4E88_06015 [Coriobacteriia bacterium]|nr:hypothetical protein [Coriobacteriia bacterium]
MYISKSKSKNKTIYYLLKSFQNPDTKKVSTRIVERIGTDVEIKKKIGNQNIDQWLKDYAKKRQKKKNR